MLARQRIIARQRKIASRNRHVTHSAAKSAKKTVSHIRKTTSKARKHADTVHRHVTHKTSRAIHKAAEVHKHSSPEKKSKLQDKANKVVKAANNVIKALNIKNEKINEVVDSIIEKAKKNPLSLASEVPKFAAKTVPILAQSSKKTLDAVKRWQTAGSETEKKKAIAETVHAIKSTSQIVKMVTAYTKANKEIQKHKEEKKKAEKEGRPADHGVCPVDKPFVNKILKDPLGAIKDVVSVPAKSVIEAKKSDIPLVKQIGEVTDLVFSPVETHKVLFHEDPETGKPTEPTLMDWIAAISTPLLFTGLGEIGKVEKLAEEGAKFGLKELGKAGEILTKKGITSETAKILTKAEEKAAENTIKEAIKIGGKDAKEVVKALEETFAKTKEFTPNTLAKVKDILYRSIKKVPAVEEVDNFILWAKRSPNAASRYLLAHIDDFSKLSTGDKTKILTELGNSLETRRMMAKVLQEMGANLEKKMPAKAKAGLGILGDAKGLLLGAMSLYGVASMPALAAIFESYSLSGGVDKLIDQGKIKEAWELQKKQEKYKDAIKSLINIFAFIPGLPAAGKSAMDTIEERLKISRKRLEELGTPPEFAGETVTEEEKVVTTEDEVPVQEYGRLQISGEPNGANVYVNGYLITKKDHASSNFTPMIIENVPVGLYKIRVDKLNYEPQEFEVYVKPDETTTLNYTLEETKDELKENVDKKAMVLINSDPPGAKLYIDGKYTYTDTPHVISLLPGQHIVELDLKGYKKIIDVINVEEGKEYTKEYTLQSIEEVQVPEEIPKEEMPKEETPKEEAPKEEAKEQTGWEYLITSDPPGAKIYVNGEYTFKKTPASVILEGNGDYVIMVDMYGYKPAFATIHTDPIE